MSYTTELIDRFKAAKGVESDYAAAKALGIRPNRISNYRCDVSHADDKTAVILADALGLDRLETIARINMDRATDRDDKAFWKSIARAAVLVVGLAVSLPYAAPADAHAVGIMRSTGFAACCASSPISS